MNPDQNVALTANFLVREAEARAMQSAILAIAKHIGLETIDKVPIADWIAQKKFEEMNEILCGLEGKNRELALALSAHIEAARRPSGDSSPNQ